MFTEAKVEEMQKKHRDSNVIVRLMIGMLSVLISFFEAINFIKRRAYILHFAVWLYKRYKWMS